MPDLPRYPDNNGAGQDREPKPRASRLVYVWWIAGIVVVLTIVALHLTGVVGPRAH